MIVAAGEEFLPFLTSILKEKHNRDRDWRDRFLHTQAQLPLRVQAEQKEERDRKSVSKQPEQFPVLEGLRKYVSQQQHVLLVGKPGSGKTTSLRRLQWEQARSCDQAIKAKAETIPPIPVLLELRSLEGSVLELLRETLEWQGVDLEEKTLKTLLRHKQLLLLLDGVNEIPTDAARKEVGKFRQFCEQAGVPLIFTTRKLGAGFDLGISQKLEMLPLTEKEVREFIEKQIPGQGEALLAQVEGRLRELAETPLLLKLLCDVFRINQQQVPRSRGELFRRFARDYDQIKPWDQVPATPGFRQFRDELLRELAAAMMMGETPTELRLQINRDEAEKRLEQVLKGRVDAPGQKAKIWLEDLIEHHLLQVATDPKQIEFHHQLFQEYYAAEWLCLRLENLGDEVLKCHYLNYLKWTEPLAMALAFVESETLAVRIIDLALDVDLRLGARLSGEVKPHFQPKTVHRIAEQNVPEWFKLFLLGETKSSKAVDEIMKQIKHPASVIRKQAVWESRKLNSKDAISIISQAIRDSDSEVRETAIQSIIELNCESREQMVSLISQFLSKEPESSVRIRIIYALESLGTESAVLELVQLLQDPDHDVKIIAAHCLESMNREKVVSILSKILKNNEINELTRINAIDLMGKIGDKRNRIDLFEAQLDLNPKIHNQAFWALDEITQRAAAQINNSTSSQESERMREIQYWRRRLNSSEPIQRGNAVCNLTTLLSKELAIPIAIEALEDTHEYVRGQAIVKLPRLLREEAIPQIVRALDDIHYEVYFYASQALLSLKEKLPKNFEISEETVSKLIRVLNEDRELSARSKTIDTIVNLGHIQPSLFLREDLENTLLNTSMASNHYLRSHPVRGLSNFRTEKVSTRLLEMMSDSDPRVVLNTTESLKKAPSQFTAKHLPTLGQLALNSKNSFALGAFCAIQENCKFYNYELWKQDLEQRNQQSEEENRDKLLSKVEMNLYGNIYWPVGNVEGNLNIHPPSKPTD